MILKENPGQISGFAGPIKTFAQRFTYLALVFSAFTLMMFGKVDPIFVDRVRANIVDKLGPVLEVTSSATETLFSAVDEITTLFTIRQTNEKLKTQNYRLLEWLALARKLEAENELLRNLLNFKPSHEASFISARVIADTSGTFANSIVLNAGKIDSVRRGQAVVVGEGLVGRVAGVGRESARILLTTDLNSRIPVAIQPGNIRAILAGDNSNYPRLIHLPPGVSVDQGDRVVTSGHGGVLPAGLPVGLIKSVEPNAIKVRLFVNQSRISFVRVLDYGISGIVELPPLSRSNPLADEGTHQSKSLK